MTLLEIVAPSIAPGLLGPLLFVFVGGCVGVLIEAFVKRRRRDEAQIGVTLGAIAGALVNVIARWGDSWRTIDGMGSVAVDGPAQAFWVLILGFGLLSALLFAEKRVYGGVTAFAPMAAAVPGSQLERDAEKARAEHTEVFPLLLFALTGMLLFASANDLLTMFVGLEIFSLPLYVLCGLARSRRLLSQESALKYFMLGALSSAIFLFGTALLFGYAGSFRFTAIDAAITSPTQSESLLIAGLALVTVGVLFKVGAVPFHNWTPDVYVGAPTPVTAFMAVCTKIAAVAALMRLLFVAFGGLLWTWRPLIAGIAILTMAVGAVIAIVQTDLKRLLAYSSITHAGFLLTAVAGAITLQNGLPAGQVGSVAGVLFYLVAYGFATLAAFAMLTMVRSQTGEATAIAQWSGLGRRHPWFGAVFTFLMLSFAGIPLTAGFIGKWAAFSAAWRGGLWWLVLVAVLISIVAVYFYLKVVLVMYFGEPDASVDVVVPGAATWIVIGCGAVVTLVLGLAPGWVLDVAIGASQFLR